MVPDLANPFFYYLYQKKIPGRLQIHLRQKTVYIYGLGLRLCYFSETWTFYKTSTGSLYQWNHANWTRWKSSGLFIGASCTLGYRKKLGKFKGPHISKHFRCSVVWGRSDHLCRKGQILSSCTSQHKEGNSTPGGPFEVLEVVHSIPRNMVAAQIPRNTEGRQYWLGPGAGKGSAADQVFCALFDPGIWLNDLVDLWY